ncbi:hypothetical protein YC2023_107402 [Brassica napus]
MMGLEPSKPIKIVSPFLLASDVSSDSKPVRLPNFTGVTPTTTTMALQCSIITHQPQASRRCIFIDVSQEPAEIDLLFRLIYFSEARNIAKGRTFIGTLQKAGPLLGWSSSNTTNRYECLYPTFFHRSSLSFGFDTK